MWHGEMRRHVLGYPIKRAGVGEGTGRPASVPVAPGGGWGRVVGGGGVQGSGLIQPWEAADRRGLT